MSKESNNQKTFKQALLYTVSKIPEEKLNFIKGQIIITKDGGTIITDIKECLPIQRYNLRK